jgi:cytochrome c
MSFKWVPAAALVTVLWSAEAPIPAHKAPPWEKNSHLLAGQQLFRDNCAVCHDIETGQVRKVGTISVPSLHHLFQNPKLPVTPVPPTREFVSATIKFGRGLMPAFRRLGLSDADVNTLVDYIQTK